MSKKRKRDGTEVDADLVDVYDRLAHEDISTRLKAAHKLLTKVYRPDTTTEDQLKSILTRLFRGLCSGRKAARLGFAVALTELLSQISSEKERSSGATLTGAQIVDILESQTSSEGHSSGQDERDHYFGRVFGAEAVIQSGLPLANRDRALWNRLLELLCAVAQKKLWLRQECGWILYQFAVSEPSETKQSFIEDVIKMLKSRKLIRTPEGVAIWLAGKKHYPNADLLDHVWKHKHPLAQKDVNGLAEIMKNARAQEIESEHDAQGTANWSASLHFAWQVVLSTVSQNNLQDAVSFEDFWQIVIDQSLFHTNSSPERKLWGMLVWSLSLRQAPLQLLPRVFTKNALHCLVTALHGQDRYLRKVSTSVLHTFQQRINTAPSQDVQSTIGACLEAIIVATEFVDFDKLTNTKFVSSVIGNDTWDEPVRTAVYSALGALFNSLDGDDKTTNYQRHRYLLDLQFKIFTADLKMKGLHHSESLSQKILLDWLSHLFGSGNLAIDIRSFLQDRIATASEQMLKSNAEGRTLFNLTVLDGKWRSDHHLAVLKFDDRLQSMIDQSFEKLRELCTGQNVKLVESEPSKSSVTLISEGLALLYSVVLLEVYCGDAEAVEILQDLPGDEMVLLTSDKLQEAEASRLCDSLVEVLLSLASRSSKLLRTATTQIFESIASKLSEEGINSLARVLATKENAQGQQEMFDLAGEGEEEVNDDTSVEDEEFDSDVEMVNGVDKPNDSSSESSSSGSASSESQNDDEQQPDPETNQAEDELQAFDAALASALRTRKPTTDDLDASSDSDSDSSMSSTAMLALDAKLSEVFRAQRAANANTKKKQRKETKEQIITFKNRVLDLVEIYLKQRSTNPLSLHLLIPLLQAIRTTTTKQLSDRMSSILHSYTSRCKGVNIPSFTSITSNQPDTSSITNFLLPTLRKVHIEATFESSNTHSTACSQSSILLVKVLVASNGDINDIINIYADTRRKQLTDKQSHVSPGFFTDWGNWCVSAREKLAR